MNKIRNLTAIILAFMVALTFGWAALTYPDREMAAYAASTEAETEAESTEAAASDTEENAKTEYTLEKKIKASDGRYYKVTATYDDKTGIPSDAVLKVEEVSPDDKEFKKLNEESEKALDKYEADQDKKEKSKDKDKDKSDKSDKSGVVTVSAQPCIIFDIKIVDAEGNEYQPNEGTAVEVSILMMPTKEEKEEYEKAYKEYVKAEKDGDSKSGTKSDNKKNGNAKVDGDSAVTAESLSELADQPQPVVHIKEDGKTEVLEASVDLNKEGPELSFSTISFSDFILVTDGILVTKSIEARMYMLYGGVDSSLYNGKLGKDAIGNYYTWYDFETYVKMFYNDMFPDPDTVKNYRYSVLYAVDTNSGHTTASKRLRAVGFFRSVVLPVSTVLPESSGPSLTDDSLTTCYCNIYLNDNALKVKVLRNGEEITGPDTVFNPNHVPNQAKEYTTEDILTSLGISSDGFLVTSRVNGTDEATTLTKTRITDTNYLPNKTNLKYTPTWAEALAHGYTSFDYNYRAAYKWTYDKNGAATNVGNNTLVIELESIARVKSDTGTEAQKQWKYFPILESTDTEQGAFDYAKTLSGNVEIELLKKGKENGTGTDDTIFSGDTAGRYTLTKQVVFDQAENITIRTTQDTDFNPSGAGHFTSALSRGYTGNSLISLNNSASTLTLENIIFDGTGHLSNTNGGFVNVENGNLQVNGGTTMQNSTQSVGNSDAENGGGAIYASSPGTLAVNGAKTGSGDTATYSVVFRNCKSDVGGGAVAQKGGNNTTVTGAQFDKCESTGDVDKGGGGGVKTTAKEAVFTSCMFSECKTSSNRPQGGGLEHYTKKQSGYRTTIEDCIFSACEAKGAGGGAETEADYVTVSNSVFTNCKSGLGRQVDGGALEVSPRDDYTNMSTIGTTLNVSNCTFTGCECSRSGGAVRAITHDTVFTNCTFNNCRVRDGLGQYAKEGLAIGGGGAVALLNADGNKATTPPVATFSGVTINDCHADKAYGGGVLIGGRTVLDMTPADNSITNCTAKDGAGIYIRSYRSAVKISGNPGFSNNRSTAKNGYINKKNGKQSYDSNNVRQDIYLTGTGNPNPMKSIIVAGQITSGDGSIYVWADNENHYVQNKQFAVFETLAVKNSMNKTQMESTLHAFRNAQDDVTTKNSTTTYLFGKKGSTANDIQIYWTGSDCKVILRKVIKSGSNFNSKTSDATFDIYKNDDVKNDGTLVEGTSAIATGSISAVGKGNGLFFIGTLPYDEYLIHEPSEDKWFYMIVHVNGTFVDYDGFRNVSFNNNNQTGFATAQEAKNSLATAKQMIPEIR